MSEQKPKAHHEVHFHHSITGDLGIRHGFDYENARYYTADEAVALGYALFEHGLYLKGRMKSGEQRADVARKPSGDQADANGQRGNGDDEQNKRSDEQIGVHGIPLKND